MTLSLKMHQLIYSFIWNVVKDTDWAPPSGMDCLLSPGLSPTAHSYHPSSEFKIYNFHFLIYCRIVFILVLLNTQGKEHWGKETNESHQVWSTTERTRTSFVMAICPLQVKGEEEPIISTRVTHQGPLGIDSTDQATVLVFLLEDGFQNFLILVILLTNCSEGLCSLYTLKNKPVPP